MAEPTGKIVARPMVVRACGCKQEFQHYEVDKYRAQRLAKFQKSRCATCVAKLNEEQRLAAAALPKKGEAIHALPVGTQIALSRKPDGKWSGTMTIDGASLQVDADAPQAVIIALARTWVMKRDGKQGAAKS